MSTITPKLRFPDARPCMKHLSKLASPSTRCCLRSSPTRGEAERFKAQTQRTAHRATPPTASVIFSTSSRVYLGVFPVRLPSGISTLSLLPHRLKSNQTKRKPAVLAGIVPFKKRVAARPALLAAHFRHTSRSTIYHDLPRSTF